MSLGGEKEIVGGTFLSAFFSERTVNWRKPSYSLKSALNWYSQGREKPFDLIDNERIRLSTKGTEWGPPVGKCFLSPLVDSPQRSLQVLHVKVWFKRSNGVQSLLV
ncbi:hypothetical protein CDAR_197761 [Caerostris darwini]|uniref:Uncharacterized protein n=1 Tax=Caerostris darwini TaxID=1538125 RepID=A0AAV4SEG3_9ARAC|nr:hypothetical protein CDAR_197761 [Caerostris darwini]